MIELYSWATPDSHQVHILLEECGLPYRVHPVDPGAGAQFQPQFLAISPAGQVPALIDPRGPDGQPISLCGSGAILVYLAVKAARFLPGDGRGKYEVLQWLLFQLASLGPLQVQVQGQGQVQVQGQGQPLRVHASPQMPTAIEGRSSEAKRLYGVLDQRLAQSGYIGGAEYTIADIAVYPGLRSCQEGGIDGSEHPRLRAWFDEISARPAVQRGCAVLADLHAQRPHLTAA